MAIRFTKPDGSQGVITLNGVDYSGPLPPNAGDLRSIYDQWLRDGNSPEPYVAPKAQPKSWTPLEFKEKFTFEERVALRELAKADPQAEDWLDLLNASTSVRSDDLRTTTGLNYVVLKGVLTGQRVLEILS